MKVKIQKEYLASKIAERRFKMLLGKILKAPKGCI